MKNNAEYIHEAMNHIDPALLDEGAVIRKGLARPLRVGLVAACLCAALVGTAFAVEQVTGVSILRYFSGEELGEVMEQIDPAFRADEEDNFPGYVIERTGEGISMEVLSPGVLDDVREKKANGEAPCRDFGDLEELEAYLGLELYDNDVLVAMLDGYRDKEWWITEDNGRTTVTQEKSRGAVLMCDSDEEGLIYFSVTDYYGAEDGLVTATVVAEAYRSGYDGGEVAYLHSEGTEFAEESYLTARGEEVKIIRCDCPETEAEDGYTTYTAHFYANGVRYSVNTKVVTQPEHGLELLKEILDGFEFKEIS